MINKLVEPEIFPYVTPGENERIWCMEDTPQNRARLVIAEWNVYQNSLYDQPREDMSGRKRLDRLACDALEGDEHAWHLMIRDIDAGL